MTVCEWYSYRALPVIAVIVVYASSASISNLLPFLEKCKANSKNLLLELGIKISDLCRLCIEAAEDGLVSFTYITHLLRLFSRVGIIMRPHRKLMDPSTPEMLLNRDILSEKTVQYVIDGKKVANRERARIHAAAMEKANAQECKIDDDMF